jgi:hypothetical protein
MMRRLQAKAFSPLDLRYKACKPVFPNLQLTDRNTGRLMENTSMRTEMQLRFDSGAALLKTLQTENASRSPRGGPDILLLQNQKKCLSHCECFGI